MANIKWPMRDKTAVVGVGFGEFGRKSKLTQMEQSQMAFQNALEDSGLKNSDIDGLLVHAGNIQCDQLPEFLGINVRWSGQIWYHGRMAAVAVQLASMVVNSGMANYCAVTCSNVMHTQMMEGGDVNVVTSDQGEEYRPGGGPHQEYPPYGMIHPGCLNTMSFGRYVEMYGGNPENLGYVAVNQRKNAALNPNAVYRTPLTIEDYRKARYVIEPLRLYDFCVNTAGAVCLIITTADRAKDTKNTPALISGMQGLGAGREYVVASMMGLGSARQSIYKYEPEKFIGTTYEMAGITQKDIGCYAMYDSFSPMVIYTIEEWGLCKTGEGLDFIAEVDTTYKGKVPINTGGGHLSSGMMNGMSIVAEAIVQARGMAGERQVKNCQYTNCLHTSLCSVIFKRGDH